MRGRSVPPASETRRSPTPPRQLPRPGSRPVAGLDRRAVGASPDAAPGPQWRAVRRVPASGGVARVLAAVAGLTLSFAFEPLALPWLLPFAVARLRADHPRPVGAHRLAAGAGLRRRLLLHPHLLDARGRQPAPGSALAAASRRCSTGCWARSRRWCSGTGSGRCGSRPRWTAVEVLRSGWPFSGMPWGRLAFAVVDTPVARALPYVGMVGVSFLLALLGALLAWLVVGRDAGAHAGALAAGCLVALVRCSPCPPCTRGGRTTDRPRRRSRWSRATCPATATTSSTTSGRSPRTTSTPRSTWPADVAGRDRAASPTS